MSPTKHSASKKSSKRARTDSDNFKSVEADMAYNDYYKRATIIMERVVKLDTLKGHLHTWSVQGKDMDEAGESDWSCVLGNH